MVKNEKGVWYHKAYVECPSCGRNEIFITRMPAPKPLNDIQIYEFEFLWCGQECY